MSEHETAPEPAPGLAVGELDTAVLRRWGDRGLDHLGRARAEIDALNVFPVPDGDTGTNLFLTFEAGVLAAARAPLGSDLAALTHTFAKGALLGARGNSGVIVAQLLRGMAQAFTDASGPVGGAQLATAFGQAADLAYSAVARPVEGTVLTVARAAAVAAALSSVGSSAEPAQSQSQSQSLAQTVSRAAAAARVALADTPNQLAALRRAGVVDAGGRGLVVLLDALESVVLNRPDDALASAWERPSVATALSAPVHGADPEGPEYEVMFLLEVGESHIPNLREQLATLGDSVVVVGGEDLWNVHVHADEPGTVVEAAVAVGRPFRIQITSLRPESSGGAPGDTTTSGLPRTTRKRGVVAVVPGQALADLFESVGATAVIGAPGARPSLAALLSAIEQCQGEDVVLLPNDSDHLVAAEAAAEHSRTNGRRVAVIPTRDPVQGLSALAVHDIARRFDDDVVSMTSAAASTRHGAVTLAVKEAMTSAGICRPGDVLGLVDGDIAVIGNDLVSVAADVIDRMLSAGGELVTLVLGADEIREREVSGALLLHLRQARPDVEVVSYDGGQEHYPLLLGVE